MTEGVEIIPALAASSDWPAIRYVPASSRDLSTSPAYIPLRLVCYRANYHSAKVARIIH